MKRQPIEIDEPMRAAARAAAPSVFVLPVRDRLTRLALWAGFGALTLYCMVRFEFSPRRIWTGIGSLLDILGKMLPPRIGDNAIELVAALLETLAMAFLGTLIAAVIALPIAFLAARNTFPFRIPRFFVRRSMDSLRAVDQLVWALVFVRAVGLGPLAGVLAIAVADIGTLAKLFSEAIENVERRQIEGVRATGATQVETVRYGILPQVLPMILSNVLYIFESNTRSATILGIVGAGGIGFLLSDRIRAFHWEEASAILIMILIAVYGIDALSRMLRRRIIGRLDAPR